jgi:hypothetical protein
LADRGDDALTYAQHALDLSREQHEQGHESWTLRLFGEITSRGQPLEAEPGEPFYRRGLALAEALGMRPLVAHCHFGLGRLYGQTSRGTPARAALAAAIELYRAMDITFWLSQAETMLAQVEGR